MIHNSFGEVSMGHGAISTSLGMCQGPSEKRYGRENKRGRGHSAKPNETHKVPYFIPNWLWPDPGSELT